MSDAVSDSEKVNLGVAEPPNDILISTKVVEGSSDQRDIIAWCAGGLLLLGILAACYVAGKIVLPICIALLLNLVFRPVMRFMTEWRVPHTFSAALIIFGLLGTIGAMGTALSGPAADWGEKLPEALPKLEQRLQFIVRPVATIQATVSRAENAATSGGAKIVNVAVRGAGLFDKLFSSTGALLGGIFETLLVLFFLLISGDTFQHRFIEILPRFQDKKKALQISRRVERDISAYLVTITVMNLMVGSVTAFIMYLFGIGDILLWGTVAFLLNYVPILGPFAALVLFAIAGMLMDTTSLPIALMPAGLYFAVHLIEAEALTPLIVSRRFTLNPAVVILMLIFWFWMWGVAGAILATPMLAILKIVCDHTKRLKALGHLLGG